jgi:nicotinamide mononucleotide adenylyltransferase
MNELSKFLVESILNESPEKVVALFGGGFKPPTKGHLDVVNKGLQNNPEVSEIKILVGGVKKEMVLLNANQLKYGIYIMI